MTANFYLRTLLRPTIFISCWRAPSALRKKFLFSRRTTGLQKMANGVSGWSRARYCTRFGTFSLWQLLENTKLWMTQPGRY